jgi:hypothetical protein
VYQPGGFRSGAKGAECRVDTKRKIILALGLKVTDRGRVFVEEV